MAQRDRAELYFYAVPPLGLNVHHTGEGVSGAPGADGRLLAGLRARMSKVCQCFGPR
jgi:hypothetical protein